MDTLQQNLKNVEQLDYLVCFISSGTSRVNRKVNSVFRGHRTRLWYNRMSLTIMVCARGSGKEQCALIEIRFLSGVVLLLCSISVDCDCESWFSISKAHRPLMEVGGYHGTVFSHGTYTRGLVSDTWAEVVWLCLLGCAPFWSCSLSEGSEGSKEDMLSDESFSIQLLFLDHRRKKRMDMMGRWCTD